MATKPPGRQTVKKWIEAIKPKLLLGSQKDNGQSTVPVRIAFCPFCGAVLGFSFSESGECPACHNNIVVNSEIESRRRLPHNPTSLLELRRKGDLDQIVLSYASKGYYIVRQTQDFVEMRKPKRFSPKWAARWFIGTLVPFGGIGVVGYAVWHVAKRESTLVIFEGKDSQVRVEETNS